MSGQGRQREAALRAAGRGLRVFPVVERRKKPPLVQRWQERATTDERQIRAWWSGQWANANLAALVPEGNFVLDVDRRHRGDETLEDLEAEHGGLPQTLTCITGNGLHLWFSAEGKLRQAANVLGPGLDTKCAGRGYAMLPDSRHPDGWRYQWASGTKAIAPAPGWLVERLPQPPALVVTPLPALEPGRAGAYGARALSAELCRVLSAPVGSRNETLHLAAVRLGQLAAAARLGVAEVTAALVGAGCRVGLDEREVQATVQTGLTYGLSHPRPTP